MESHQNSNMLYKGLIVFTIIIMFVLTTGKSDSSSSEESNDTSDSDYFTDARDKSSYSNQKPLSSLHKCYKKYQQTFRDCYKDVKIVLNKKLANITLLELIDFKCSLYNGFYECLNLKTEIYCGMEMGKDLKKLTSVVKPLMGKECNKTGVINARSINFSI